MKAKQTQNASQFGAQPRALQSDMLAFFNKSEARNREFGSFKTLMFVTLTNFAATALYNRTLTAGNERCQVA